RSARVLSLAFVVIVTAALWSGVSQIELNGDDYQYIESMAPLRTASDALRPFVSPDANPAYYRPLSNATLAANFLFSHFNGGLYHLTNLFLHLIATVLVFFFVRKIFGLRDIPAIILSLAFGIGASHEYNLVVD